MILSLIFGFHETGLTMHDNADVIKNAFIEPWHDYALHVLQIATKSAVNCLWYIYIDEFYFYYVTVLPLSLCYQRKIITYTARSHLIK